MYKRLYLLSNTNSSYFVGPRRIFTKRPVDERYLVHSVQFGRYGRKGWLQVDSFANITGKAPGARENLNITSKVCTKSKDLIAIQNANFFNGQIVYKHVNV